MDTLYKLISNKLINAAFIAWFVAQLLKVMIDYISNKEIDLSRFLGAGGMPSSHSASVSAVTTCLFRMYGFSSTEFAISLIFSLIIMYDASGVRLAVGKQAAILNKIIYKLENNSNFDNSDFFDSERLQELIGHTPLEVLAGAILGIIIGLLTRV